MTNVLDRDEISAASSPNSPVIEKVVKVDRKMIDRVLVALGVVVAVVLAVAGGLLTWGANFADGYVFDELSAQNISFPAAEALDGDASLSDELRAELMPYAGEQLTTGQQAELYAGYIDAHLGRYGGTYAELGAVEREARAAVTAAEEAGASEAELAELQEASAQISRDRDTVFKGETLRGLLLTTYAWSTIGQIAGIAAIAAYIAAAAMAILVVFGIVHMARLRKA